MTNHYTYIFSRHAILIWLNCCEVGVNLEKKYFKCKIICVPEVRVSWTLSWNLARTLPAGV